MDQPAVAPQPPTGVTAGQPLNRKRAVAGAAVVLVVLAGAALTIYQERHSFVHSLHDLGPAPLIGSLALAMVGVGCSGLMWLVVLGGLGVDLGRRDGLRVFFTTQLGKYVPGSVWPMVMQMQAGRSRGANPRTVLAGNLINLALSCGVGLLLACLVLPLSDASALEHYWWALFAVPLLLVSLHPRVLPGLLDWAFARVHRDPLGERLALRAEGIATLWSVLSWLAYGTSVGVLGIALGLGVAKALLLGVGGMALAVPLGLLFIPAPAGAGIRDVVLTLVLASSLPTGKALAAVVASRVIFIVCDLGWAAIAVTFRGKAPSSA